MPDIYWPDQLRWDTPPNLAQYQSRMLVEGDSWFSAGTLKLLRIDNIPKQLRFARSTAMLMCAAPGDTLKHMVQRVHNATFDGLLHQAGFQLKWDAIVFSGGGNDLIAALRVPPTNKKGKPNAIDRRLLLSRAEAMARYQARTGQPLTSDAQFVAADWFSEAGWDTLKAHLRLNFETLVRRRDFVDDWNTPPRTAGANNARPIFIHTYVVPVVRPYGTGSAKKGWLYPPLEAGGVPPGIRQDFAVLLFGQLQAFLLSLDMANGATGLKHFHVFDSASTCALIPADPTAKGASGDWENEIHPTREGYRKIGQLFGPWIESVLTRFYA